MAELLSGPAVAAGLGEEARLVRNAKKIALLLMGVAYQKSLAEIEKQREVLAGITDVVMDVFAMESAWLRTQKMAAQGKGAQAADMCAVLLRDSMAHIENAARTVLAACAEGGTLRTNLLALRRFTKFEPVDSIALRRRIASRLIESERYSV
jgi:hypothetical protein